MGTSEPRGRGSGRADAELDRRLRSLRDRHGRCFTEEEVVAIVERVLSSLQCEPTAGDAMIQDELEALARFIRDSKDEIRAIRPHQINSEFVPLATGELEAIVLAAEEATNGIMEAAETVEAVADELGGEPGARLVEAATAIYEACAFQDITGQRVAKVVKTLALIETKVDAILAMLGEEGRGAEQTEPAPAAPGDDGTPADHELMNGPQLPGNAATQDEIDALFSGGD